MDNLTRVENKYNGVTKPSVAYWILSTILILGAVFYVFRSEIDGFLTLALVFGFIYLAAILVRPQFATLSYIFIVCTNLAVIAYKFHHVPKIAVGLTFLLIFIPFLVEIFIRRRTLCVDHAFFLLLFFFFILFVSMFNAKDYGIALDWILTFIVEGLIIYFAIINVIRDYALLRKAVWVLILAGCLMGSLCVYQNFTGSYENQFGGFAQRNLSRGAEKKTSMEKNSDLRKRDVVQNVNRAQGPIGEKNYFAQIMLFLLPLSFFRFKDEKTLILKTIAGLCFIFILCGLLLTYSRGAFLILCILILLLAAMRIVRPYQIAITLLVILLGIVIAAPGYFNRMSTIKGLDILVSKKKTVDSNYSIRGRATEMLATWKVFLDYPILGVGPGQYSPFYSQEYMSKDDIAFKRITTKRRSHNLYLEIAAETGVFGLSCFMAIVIVILCQLFRIIRINAKHRLELADMAAAFFIAILGYLGTGVFLSFAYQRYYWLIIGLAGATIQIAKLDELGESDKIENTHSLTYHG